MDNQTIILIYLIAAFITLIVLAGIFATFVVTMHTEKDFKGNAKVKLETEKRKAELEAGVTLADREDLDEKK